MDALPVLFDSVGFWNLNKNFEMILFQQKIGFF